MKEVEKFEKKKDQKKRGKLLKLKGFENRGGQGETKLLKTSREVCRKN